MSPQTPSVLEIDRKLRDDFRRRVKDFGVSTDTIDPLLAVLFRTVAQQVDQIYGDTDQLRGALLHELMDGLNVQQYLARPAQAAVRFVSHQPEPRILRNGTELNAVAASGERLTFGLDATVEISQARIAFALSYQDQSLRLLTGVEMSEAVQAMRPSMEPTPIGLGPHPALFLAIENLSPSLLNRHGIFFDLGPGSYPVQHALCNESWWIFDENGDLSSEGLLRPKRTNGGVYQLAFQLHQGEEASHLDAALPSIPDGFYSGRQFVFPPMYAGDRFLCRCPRLLEPALSRLLNRDASRLLEQPRLWIKISMPKGTPTLHHAVNGILLHSMTASNVYARNQTVDFDRHGTSIPVTRQGDTPEYLVAPLSIMSVENEPYESVLYPRTKSHAGRFALHNGKLTLYPGTNPDGSSHDRANVRLWLTNGELGNQVGPGDITGFAHAAAMTGIRLAPFTAAAGGANVESLASAERRFADALLTRGRIVTRTDLETSALALDRRIVAASISSGLERREGGLRRVERLLLTLDTQAFDKPEIELPMLRSQVETSLRSRLVQGLELEVQFVWKN